MKTWAINQFTTVNYFDFNTAASRWGLTELSSSFFDSTFENKNIQSKQNVLSSMFEPQSMHKNIK